MLLGIYPLYEQTDKVVEDVRPLYQCDLLNLPESDLAMPAAGARSARLTTLGVLARRSEYLTLGGRRLGL